LKELLILSELTKKKKKNRKGELGVIRNDGHHESFSSSHLFLFSDVLAITVNENDTQEENQKWSIVRWIKRFFQGHTSNESYWLRCLINLPISVAEVGHSSSPFAFKLQAPNASFILVAENQVDQTTWVEAIQSTATRRALNDL